MILKSAEFLILPLPAGVGHVHIFVNPFNQFFTHNFDLSFFVVALSATLKPILFFPICQVLAQFYFCADRHD